jgi:regulator of protease activity HflC (stomatin/prohibitin superfamily)
MARISKYPGIAHLRSEASSHVIRYRNGQAVSAGRGLSFWFRPLDTAIAEVPLDDQELSFLFHGRSADLQEVVAQGIITYRVTDPDTLAARIDFGIDLATGLHSKTPLDQITARLTGLAQQHAWAVMAATPLRELVANGVGRLRERIGEGLDGDASVTGMGLAIASVRVSAVQPSAEVEKALAAPTRERIAADADEAAFARRAAAVDKERAIAENELANRIGLARREADLVGQEARTSAGRRPRSLRPRGSSPTAMPERAGSGPRPRPPRSSSSRRSATPPRPTGSPSTATSPRPCSWASRRGVRWQDRDHRAPQPHAGHAGTLVSDLLAAGTRRLEAGTPEA